MIRIFCWIFSIFYLLNLYKICDYYWPINSILYNNSWDALKHALYLSFAFFICIIPKIKSNEKFDKHEKLVKSILLLGVIIPMIIDKGTNRYLKPDWWDYILIILSVYFGMKDVFPKLHKYIGENIIGKKLYNWLITLGNR